MVEEGDVEETEKGVEAEECEEVLVEEEAEKDKEKETPTLPKPILKENNPLPHFQSQLRSTKREREEEDIMEFFLQGLPPKCKDSRIFSVPCKLWNLDFPKAMLDLRASVNVLLFYIFEKLKLGSLQNTRTIIQLADHSTVHPKGVLEDVLVQVDNLIFPADFYILDMGNLDTFDTNSIILGSPFVKTAKTKIDVFNGIISMKFDEEVVKFQINN
ncbi:uncharacterized protein LOC111906523 [Lactuca sativa]|uniref:uncharacterized protein LOC111906523 n=1 Tax=Lactuca sativa TaxID=4236 RepID=UPI0022AEE586|nr:uncharacterized protein LOC111906523 [Lactuca sativa]